MLKLGSCSHVRITPTHAVVIVLIVLTAWSSSYEGVLTLPGRRAIGHQGRWLDTTKGRDGKHHHHHHARYSAQDLNRFNATASSNKACPQQPPDSCFQITRDCGAGGHLDNCLVVRPLCRLGEFYPVLTLRQGNASASVLAKPYPHKYSNAMMLDFSCVRGLNFRARANLTIRTYFHCAVDMYGRDAFFIGLSDQANTSALNLNSVIHADEELKLERQSPQSARLCDTHPLSHVAVDLESCRLIDDGPAAPPVHPKPPLGATAAAAAAPAAPAAPAAAAVAAAAPPAETAWVHLVGDSNMRRIFGKLCELCPADRLRVEWTRRAGTFGTCVCASDGRAGQPITVAIHYSFAWLDTAPLFNHTGLDLCAIVGPGALGSGVCKKAALTLVSLGSHTPHYTIEELRASVPRSIEAYYNATGGAMAVALTTAACIEKIPAKYERTHGTWELLQRNNYRLMALNEMIIEETDTRRIPVIDLFAWSLSAGCGHFVDAVHMSDRLYGQLAGAIARAWIRALV